MCGRIHLIAVYGIRYKRWPNSKKSPSPIRSNEIFAASEQIVREVGELFTEECAGTFYRGAAQHFAALTSSGTHCDLLTRLYVNERDYKLTSNACFTKEKKKAISGSNIFHWRFNPEIFVPNKPIHKYSYGTFGNVIT